MKLNKAAKRTKALSQLPNETSTNPTIVLVTVQSLVEGQRIATNIVKKKLAACVNILLSPVSSVYRWKERVEVAHEYLLLIKTTAPVYAALEREIARTHSYEVPEIISLPVVAGLPEYLTWLRASVT